jgi:hypothetical protein
MQPLQVHTSDSLQSFRIPSTGTKCRIYGEKTNTPAVLSDLSNYTTRQANKTTSYVDWDGESITVDLFYNTPSLVSILQEIVNLGTTTGVSIFLDDNGSATNNLYGFQGGDDTEAAFWFIPILRPAVQEVVRFPGGWRHD